MRQITVLFQAPNGIGLGHISRLAAIAQALRSKVPSARVPFLLEGGSHSLLEAASLPYLTLPNNHALYESGSWEAWPKEERYSLIVNIAESIIRRIRPELILFDTIPCIPVVIAAANRKIPAAICVRKVKEMGGYFERLDKFQEQIKCLIIPHETDEVGVPSRWLPRTRFVGRIVRSNPRADVKLNLPAGSKTIVISGGGGGYPNTVDFYNWALTSFATCQARNPDLICLLVTGPLFNDWWKLNLINGVRVIPFDPNLISIMANADLVICQAGYNTIAEVTQLGVPTICVPADRGMDDQYERAKQSAASNSNFHICRASEKDRLTLLIDRCLKSPSTERSSDRIASMGATRAAEALLELITEIPLE